MARPPLYKPNLDLEDQVSRADIESKALFFMETIREMLDNDDAYAAYQSVYKTEVQPLGSDTLDAALARKAWASLFSAHIEPAENDQDLVVNVLDRLQLLDPNEPSPFQWGISTKVANSPDNNSYFSVRGDDSVKSLADLSPQIAAQVWLLERGLSLPHVSYNALNAVSTRREQRQKAREMQLAATALSDNTMDTEAGPAI